MKHSSKLFKPRDWTFGPSSSRRLFSEYAPCSPWNAILIGFGALIVDEEVNDCGGIGCILVFFSLVGDFIIGVGFGCDWGFCFGACFGGGVVVVGFDGFTTALVNIILFASNSKKHERITSFDNI